MMNFNQINDKISANGYRRKAAARKFYDDDYNMLKVYDYEHRKKLDMFSVYINEYESVEFVEFTKVDFDQRTGKFSQKVSRIDNLTSLAKFL